MRWSSPWWLAAASVAAIGCGRLGYDNGAQAGRDGAGMDGGPGSGMDGASGPLPVCGDGEVAGGEICDDGNTEDGDGCSADCSAREICGDGITTGSER